MSTSSPDETLSPDYDVIDAHLDRIDSGSVWVLTSVEETGDKTRTHTATFGSPTRKQAHTWIGEQQAAGRSVYIHYNAVKGRPKSKPKKEAVIGLSWLYVDLDPAKPPEGCADVAAHYAAERERIRVLCENLPSGIPKPTVCVFSGGGYQLAWRLKTPELADGSKERVAELERYSRRLEEVLGGDNCHNLDRMLRLAGTVNFPSARKRAAGRVPVLSELCWADGPTAELGQFEKAAPKSASASSSERPAPSGVTKLDNLDALDVPDFCKVVLAQGCDPDDPGRFGGAPSMYGLSCGAAWMGDRSDAVWYVVCELVRSGVDDDTIRALLLDEGWGISGHVLDQKDPERCADRQIDNAREKAGDGDDDPGGDARPLILTNPGRHAEIVDEAERALLGAGAPIYQRGPELVRPVVLDRSESEGGVNRARGATVIQPVSAAWLHDAMSRVARWRYREKKGLSPDDPMDKHARTLLARAGAWSFPVLRGIVTAPTLRADGSILQVPGYDPTSGLIFEPGGATFPPVPERPTRDEAVAALAKFDPLFAEFPFVDEAARAVVFSAILSGLVGQVLPSIPLHAFDAPTAGTGKSLLAETVGAIVLGHKPSAMNQGKEEAEDEKRLATALRAGDRVIWIDNVERPITGDTICSILTQESVLLRILGKSEQVTLPCNVLVMATGNNLTIGGDVTRRSVVCRLDARDERPDQREFRFNPKVVAAERRAEFVVAGLTALRAYLVAGRPNPLSPVGSFERWSEWVREALVWCGYGDPDETRTAVLADDPRKGELVEVLQAWRRAWGDNAVTVSEAKQDEPLAALLVEVTGRTPLSTKSVGWWLKRNVDRVVAGLVIRRLGDSGAVRWRVEALDGRPPERGHQAERDEIDEDVLG